MIFKLFVCGGLLFSFHAAFAEYSHTFDLVALKGLAIKAASAKDMQKSTEELKAIILNNARAACKKSQFSFTALDSETRELKQFHIIPWLKEDNNTAEFKYREEKHQFKTTQFIFTGLASALGLAGTYFSLHIEGDYGSLVIIPSLAALLIGGLGVTDSIWNEDTMIFTQLHCNFTLQKGEYSKFLPVELKQLE